MFGKMRLLVGCRSGMTVKFASKFHHGNPFVRGLLFAGSAVPFRGHCAVRCWCSIGCARPPLRRGAIDAHLCDVAFAGAASARAKASGCCAGIVRKRFSCVARRADMPRTFLAWRSFAPMHSTRICAALFIVTFTSHGGRKRQENYTAKRLLPCSSCFASACLLGAIPARRDTQKERMPGSPSERCTGRRPANWS